MRQIMFVATIVALLSSCAGDSFFQKEKKYSPVYLYYNPLDPGVYTVNAGVTYLMPSMICPQFVNYPTDWVKFGLRDRVSTIKYVFPHTKAVVKVAFDNRGRLGYVYSGAAPYDEAEICRLDNQDRFCGVVRERGNSPIQTLEYDSANRVVKRYFNDASVESQIYNYYEDGTLKEIIPTIRANYRNKKSNITGKLEFNKSGELIRMESIYSHNPFINCLGDELRNTSSISTFKYSGGLCTEKLEKILWKDSNGKIDTIPCMSQYTYNENDDIEKIFYRGAYRYVSKDKRKDYLTNDTLSIRFSYDYDSHKNWTAMYVTLPDNFVSILPLLRYYSFFRRSLAEPTVSFHREIEYHEKTAEEEAEARAEEIKKNTPKFTAVQGYGLYGRVKSVTSKDYEGNNVTMIFNEYGNIINDGYNEYTFSSPTEYSCGIIGPFKISCEGNIRKEEDIKGIEGTAEYEFDKKGRVVRHKISSMHFEEEKFIYEGKGKHPIQSMTEFGDEVGTYITTNKYSYVEFDEQGNWIKRKVNSSWENEEYLHDENDTSEKSTGTKPEYMETRSITYYK